MAGKPVGFEITSTYCLACAPESLVEFYLPDTDEHDYGIPRTCDTCGQPMTAEKYVADHTKMYGEPPAGTGGPS